MEEKNKQNNKEKEEKPKKIPLNECCKDCLKWEHFAEECWVFWEGKKECSHKVGTQDEWDYEKLLLKKE